MAGQRKSDKYSDFLRPYLFQPIAVLSDESLGTLNSSTTDDLNFKTHAQCQEQFTC